jgi:SSS family solute:Na+ symporter
VFLAILLTAEERRDQALEFFNVGHMNFAMAIVFVAFGIFIVFQSAEYWQRVYGAKSNKVVKRGFIGSAILVIITGIAITLIGLAAYHKVPGLEAKNAFSEGLKILIPKEYLGAGLILIFAAIMSSADTQIFVLASSASKDFISNILKKELTQNQLKRATKLFIVLFSLLAFVMAYFFRDLVTVIVFITGIGFTIIPAAIASFHVKLKNEAVIASFLGGLLYIVVIIILGKLIPEYAIFSIVIATVVLIFFQIFYSPPTSRGEMSSTGRQRG